MSSIFCISCGTRNQQIANYCFKCGTKLQKEEKEAKKDSSLVTNNKETTRFPSKNNDKYNKQNILLLLQNGKIDTFETTKQICSLLSTDMKQHSYFYEYQKCIKQWLDFDFYVWLCKCGALNNSIMVNRIFHYAAKSEQCRICDVIYFSHNMLKRRKNKKYSLPAYSDDKEGANLLDTTYDDEEYVNYETGNFIRYKSWLPRFQSLMEECTLNDIIRINKNTFSRYLSCAKKCHSKLACIVVATKDSKNYGIIKYAPIDVGHILALIIYTEEIIYSRLFTRSHLSLNCTDPDIIIKNHCNNWYWFGKYLFETIEFFGESFDGYSDHKLFQGSMTLFKFNSFTFSINFPRAISISQMAAKQFAADRGVVIELVAKYKSALNNIKTINPCLVSDRYNQEMRLLFGTHGAVQIQDIILLSNKKTSLTKYIASLSYLEKITSQTIFDTKFFNASHLYDDSHEVQDILMNLINICVDLQKINSNPNQIGESAVKSVVNKHMSPNHNKFGISYIITLMIHWCFKREFVTFEAFKSEIPFLHKNLKQFFIHKNRINIYNLRRLLPNITCFRNFQNKVQYINEFLKRKSIVPYAQNEDKKLDVIDCETISQILPGSPIHEVPNHIINALDDILFQYGNTYTIKAMLKTKLRSIKNVIEKEKIPKILQQFHVEKDLIYKIEKQLEDIIDIEEIIVHIIKSLDENNYPFPPLSTDIQQQKNCLMTICKDLLMLYHRPISKSIDVTEQDFVNVTKKIDLFDKVTSAKLSNHLFEKLLKDIERIKPWKCNFCWFKNRKMMVGGYFRYYNQLNSCGLCGKLRRTGKRYSQLLEKRIHKIIHQRDRYYIPRPVNKLSLPYIAPNWVLIKGGKCGFNPKQIYIQSYKVEQIIELTKSIIDTMNYEILIKNKNEIIGYFKDEQIDGQTFMSLSKKEFASMISKK
eukprot:127232_1